MLNFGPSHENNASLSVFLNEITFWVTSLQYHEMTTWWQHFIAKRHLLTATKSEQENSADDVLLSLFSLLVQLNFRSTDENVSVSVF